MNYTPEMIAKNRGREARHLARRISEAEKNNQEMIYFIEWLEVEYAKEVLKELSFK